MRPFVFRLHRLERLRETERRDARSALLEALFELELRRERRTTLEAVVREADAVELPEELASSPRALRDLVAWREVLREDARRAEEREGEAFQAFDEARRRYSEAARAHSVLEKLHERKRARWLDEAAREEQKLLDELHLLRIAREQGERSPSQ